jgi:hypothetical protein
MNKILRKKNYNYGLCVIIEIRSDMMASSFMETAELTAD